MGSIILRERESNRRERGGKKCRVGSFGGSFAKSRWIAYLHVLGHISQSEKPSLPPVNGPVQSFYFPTLLHFDLYKVLSLPHWFLLSSHLHSPPPRHSKESRKSAQRVYCILYTAECIARVTLAVYLQSFPVNKEKKKSLHFQPHCILNANQFVIHGKTLCFLQLSSLSPRSSTLGSSAIPGKPFTIW